MLIFKIVATFLLLWLAAGIIGLIFDSRVSRGFPTSVTRLLRGYADLPFVARVRP